MPKQMKEETEKDVKKLLCSKSSEVQEVKQTSPSKTVTKLPLAPPITTLTKRAGLPRHSHVPIVGTTGGSTSSGSRSSGPLTSSGSRHIQVDLRRKYGTEDINRINHLVKEEGFTYDQAAALADVVIKMKIDAKQNKRVKAVKEERRERVEETVKNFL